MAQIEVYEFLKTQRLKGKEDYFTAQDIYKGLEKKITLNKLYVSLIKLEAFEYLEAVRKGKVSNFHRAFRLKEKYITGG